MDGENTAILAKTFFKNRESTLMSYYTINWMQREAVRLTWKCHQKFTLSNEEKNIVKVQEELYGKPVPTKQKIKTWFEKHLEKLGEKTTRDELHTETDDLLQWLKEDTNEDLVDFILSGKFLKT